MLDYKLEASLGYIISKREVGGGSRGEKKGSGIRSRQSREGEGTEGQEESLGLTRERKQGSSVCLGKHTAAEGACARVPWLRARGASSSDCKRVFVSVWAWQPWVGKTTKQSVESPSGISESSSPL